MIYLDTSVALAVLLAEDRAPPDTFWRNALIASRLLQYELWTRLHATQRAASHREAVAGLLARVALVELAPNVLSRALRPFATVLRTLDALHLSTCDFLRQQGQDLQIATYDDRLARAARREGFALVDCG